MTTTHDTVHVPAADEVPAGIRVHTCYAVACTVCGAGTDIDDEYTPHFPTRADALAYWTSMQSWSVGPTGMRCPACTCTADGHAWDEPFGGWVQCQHCLHLEPRRDSGRAVSS